MFRVALINMPFANLNVPSIALTQLKAVVDRAFGDAVQTDIFHLNHDFAELIGLDTYREIANSIYALNAGIGDWMFRQAAFPELADNAPAYFQRYFPRKDEPTLRLRQAIVDVRSKLDEYIAHLIDAYSLGEYGLVGFTSMFAQTVPALAVARHLKTRNPGIVTVMGGANCEAPMGQELVTGAPQLDYVFSGPALISFTQFVGHVLNGEHDRIREITGVFDRKTGSAQRGRTIIGDELDIDDVIELDYGAFIEMVETRYPNRDVPVILPFETSRGCWWGERAHCTFCGLNGLSMGYRSMDPEKAHALITSLFRYAPVATRLECVDNIMPKTYIDTLFSRLQTPDDLVIFYEVKADLTEADLRTLSAARVRILQPGIEALATSTLKLMRKGTTSFSNIAFLINCVRYEIHPTWNLLIGFPGEQSSVYEKYLRDLPKLTHLPPPSGVFPVRFDRFSPYFKDAQHYGLELQPLPFYELTYPFDRQSLANLAYYFGDRNYRADYLKGVVQFLGSLQRVIDSWRQRWELPDRPELSLLHEAGRTRVRDSRAGAPVVHELSELAADILYAIERRRKRTEIGRTIGRYSDPEIAKGMRELEERDLVFEESDMFMSLAMQQKGSEQKRELEAALV